MNNAENMKENTEYGSPEKVIRCRLDKMNAYYLSNIFWPLDIIFKLKHKSLLATLSCCILFLGIPPLLLILISWYEGTLIIQGEGVGLLEHTGFMAFFFVHILLILLLPRTITKFAGALSKIEKTVDFIEVNRKNTQNEVVKIFRSADKLIAGNIFTKTFKLIAIFIGIASVVYNAINTIEPIEVYHHEVWDGLNYLGGYLGARIYLLFCWGLVLSVTLYGLLFLCYIIFRVYSMLGKIGPVGVVSVRPLSPDRSGGLKHINTAMMAVVINVFPLALFTVTLVYIHGITVPVVVGTIGWIFFVCCIFFIPLSSVHIAMSKRKQMILGEIEAKFNVVHDEFRISLNSTNLKLNEPAMDSLPSMYFLHIAYEISEKMPVWPFDIRTLSKFFSVIALQMLLTIISAVFSKIF